MEGLRTLAERAVLCVAWMLLLAGPGAKAQEPAVRKGDQAGPVPGSRIAKGIVCDGKLWLRSVNLRRKEGPGGLASLDLSDQLRTVRYERGVVDIEKSGGQLWVLHESVAQPAGYILSVWKDGAFSDVASFSPLADDQPI